MGRKMEPSFLRTRPEIASDMQHVIREWIVLYLRWNIKPIKLHVEIDNDLHYIE